jgi:capsular polysaccharide biosynthesis protein
MVNMDNNTVENENLSLRQLQGSGLPAEGFVQIAMRHRWLILSTTAFFLLVAFIYILKATPIYTSSSRVYVEQTGPRIINEYEGFMTRSSNYLYTQGELIKSTNIVIDAINDPQMKGLKTFAGLDNVAAYVRGNLSVSLRIQTKQLKLLTLL